MTPLDFLKATSVPILWATGFVLAKVAIVDFPPILLMALRFALTAMVLVWFFRPPRHLWGKLFMVALISGSIQYSLTFSGLKHLDASTAGLIVQLEVPFAALTAVIFLRERLTLVMVAGMLIAFIGVGVLSGEPKLDGQALYVLMVVAGAFTWAIGQVMVRSIGEIGGFVMISGVAICATPQLFVATYLFEAGQWEAIQSAGWSVWIAVVYMGLVMTALAYAIWYDLLGRLPVNNVAPFLLLLPVAVVIESVLFLHEELTPLKVLGGVLILVGVAALIFAQRPAKRPIKPSPDPA